MLVLSRSTSMWDRHLKLAAHYFNRLLSPPHERTLAAQIFRSRLLTGPDNQCLALQANPYWQARIQQILQYCLGWYWHQGEFLPPTEPDEAPPP